MSRLVLALSAGLFVVAFDAGALAQTATPSRPELSRAEIVAMLSTYESSPSSARWRSMGERMVAPLVEIYADNALPPYVRIRALVAIGAFRTRVARQTLIAAATDPQTPEMHAREAVLALGRTFGADVLDVVAARLDDSRPLVREAAARALARIPSVRARSIVRTRLRSEADPVVRDALRGL